MQQLEPDAWGFPSPVKHDWEGLSSAYFLTWKTRLVEILRSPPNDFTPKLVRDLIKRWNGVVVEFLEEDYNKGELQSGADITPYRYGEIVRRFLGVIRDSYPDTVLPPPRVPEVLPPTGQQAAMDQAAGADDAGPSVKVEKAEDMGMPQSRDELITPDQVADGFATNAGDQKWLARAVRSLNYAIKAIVPAGRAATDKEKAIKLAIGKLRAKCWRRMVAIGSQGYPHFQKLTKIEYRPSGTKEGVKEFGVNRSLADTQQLINRANKGMTGYGEYYDAGPMQGYGGFFQDIGNAFKNDVLPIAKGLGKYYMNNARRVAQDGLAEAMMGGFGEYYDGTNPAEGRQQGLMDANAQILAQLAEQRRLTEQVIEENRELVRQAGRRRARAEVDGRPDDAGMPSFTMDTTRGEPIPGGAAPILTWNNLVNFGKRGGRQPMHFLTKNSETGELIFTHREYILDLISKVGGQFESLPEWQFEINAGLSKTFPAGSSVAKLFQTWRPIQMMFKVFSNVTAGNSTAAGTIDMAFISNPYAAYYTNKKSMQNSTNAVSNKVDGDLELGIECNPSDVPVTGGAAYFVRTGPLPPGAEADTFDKGRVQVALCGVPPNFAVGELWGFYTIALQLFWGELPDDLLVGEGISLQTLLEMADNTPQGCAQTMFGYPVALPPFDDTLADPVELRYPLPNWTNGTMNGKLAEPGTVLWDSNSLSVLGQPTQSSTLIASYTQSPNITAYYGNTVPANPGTGDPFIRLKMSLLPGSVICVTVVQMWQSGATTPPTSWADDFTSDMNSARMEFSVIEGPLLISPGGYKSRNLGFDAVGYLPPDGSTDLLVSCMGVCACTFSLQGTTAAEVTIQVQPDLSTFPVTTPNIYNCAGTSIRCVRVA